MAEDLQIESHMGAHPMPPALCHRWMTALPLVLLLASSSSAWAATTTYTTEAAFLTVAGTPILIDFDGLSNNDSIDTQFVGSGVTFGPFNGGGPQAREVTVPPFCVENHSEPTSSTPSSALRLARGDSSA
jgi:hypothetical protein